ncbi:MAG: DEAD/DEAH box helicase [Candidatus Woesearchaeota archaeon]
MDTILVDTIVEDYMKQDKDKIINYLKDFTPRLYQENIFNTCTKNNTLVVLPTGVGKTAIFLMMAAYRLNLYPKSKILLLGPTRPLIDQYYSVFEKHFNIDKSLMAIFTGFVPPDERAKIWKDAQIIFSTPQGLENDILSSKIDISNISLLGFDESHRATGEYSYNFVAKQYMQKALHPRILALTASPGTDQDTIHEVMQNLFIEKIEVRSIEDQDVAPYVKDVDIKKIFVELPDEFLNIKKYLETCYKSKLNELKNLGFTTDAVKYSKKNLLGLQAEIHSKVAHGERDFETLRASSLLAEAIKIHHAIELVETQGIESLKTYMDKLQGEARTGQTKATINLVKDINFRSAYILAEKLNGKFEHPKFEELKIIIQEELSPDNPENSSKKIIIFSQYRDSGNKITKDLSALGFKTKLFVGQAKKKDTGLSQKKQKEMIEQFSNSDFNILVSSSVGEEGLDIPQVDLVIFYEPVPSAIRKIQRSGRTGRLDDGRIIMLITKDTVDEIYYHVAKNKERRMYRTITDITKTYNNGGNITGLSNINNVNSLANGLNDAGKARTLMDYQENKELPLQSSKPKIIADYREKGSNVLKELLDKSNLGLEKLAIGDFLLSGRVAVEYKTVQDFVDSIIDGRLLGQLRELKKYERPIIIIEGTEDIYSMRKIHPNSIRGMIATITVSYGIPIIQTRNSKDTAEYLISIAKREQSEEKNDIQHHYKKPETIREQQEYFISALPNIGMGGAIPLLKHFKSVKNIVNASEKELRDVDLIGPKKSKSLKEIFDKDWEE